MGLLLSVLVACVGVIELITFYYNVRRNVAPRHVSGDLSSVREGYIQGLYDVRNRIIKDLQNLQCETSDSSEENGLKEVQRPAPALRLNSHEDIEIEYNRNVLARSSPSGPRRFLVTEKDATSRERTPSPRRFVVSEDPHGIRKSQCKSSIPEFLIQEQNNSKKSPNRPRYVLKDHEGRSGSPIPLPSQFIVTEQELEELVSQDGSGNESSHGRSPSPYPPLELPHGPRNSVSNELVDHPVVSVREVDEEVCRSRSPSPRNVDVLEESSFNSKQYWKNKSLVVPSKKSKSRSPSPACGKKHRSASPQVTTEDLKNGKLQRSMSKSESEINNNYNIPTVADYVTKVASNLEVSTREEWDESASAYEVLEEEENSCYDEKYLNSLDGVSKQKSIRRKRSCRKTVPKNTLNNNLEKASSSNSEESTKSENTPNVLVNDVEELEKALTNEIRENSEAAGCSKSTENKKPEPFWVKN